MPCRNPIPQWAQDTLATINGGRGLMMLGAKHVSYDNKTHTVSMKLPRNASGGNILQIQYLPGKDLYDVRIQSARMGKKGYSVKNKAELNDAYGDMIGPFVERATGMYLSLGTMGRRNPKGGMKPPKGKTKQVVDYITKELKKDSNWTFHPSIFTYSGFRSNTAPAIRYLREMGIIEEAYRNVNNQPVWGLAKSLKANPSRSELLRAHAWEFARMKKGGGMLDPMLTKHDIAEFIYMEFPKNTLERFGYPSTFDALRRLSKDQLTGILRHLPFSMTKGYKKGIEEMKKKNPKGKKWSGKVVEHYHTPAGLFEKTAGKIVTGMLRGAKGDAGLASKRLNFYINRAGKNLTNKRSVLAAKKRLVAMNKRK